MNLLIVNHYDSFVFNLVSWFQKHSSYHVFVIDYQDLPNSFNKHFFNKYQAIIFSPGPGHPKEYKKSIDLYKQMPINTPFFGVCLGHQIMLHANHARIKQIKNKPIHGQQIFVKQKKSSKLVPKSGKFSGKIVLYNSLGISVKDFVFKETFHLLMSYENFSLVTEHTILPQIGVQFHPESFASPNGKFFMKLFLRLLK